MSFFNCLFIFLSLLTFFFKSIAWNLLSRIPYSDSVSVSGFPIPDSGLHILVRPLSGFLTTSSTPDYGKSGSLGIIHTLQYQRDRVRHSKSSEEAISTADKSQEILEQCIGFQLRFSFLQSFCLVSC